MSKYKTESGATIWVIPYAVSEEEAIKMANLKFKTKLENLEAVEAYEINNLLYLEKTGKARKVWAVAKKGEIQ